MGTVVYALSIGPLVQHLLPRLVVRLDEVGVPVQPTCGPSRSESLVA
jgi:hypothetical protein